MDKKKASLFRRRPVLSKAKVGVSRLQDGEFDPAHTLGLTSNFYTIPIAWVIKPSDQTKVCPPPFV